jgi:hypothetical protein
MSNILKQIKVVLDADIERGFAELGFPLPFSIKKLGPVNGGAAKRKHAQNAEIALKMEKIAR